MGRTKDEFKVHTAMDYLTPSDNAAWGFNAPP